MSDQGIKKLKKFGFKFDGNPLAAQKQEVYTEVSYKDMVVLIEQVNDDYDENGVTREDLEDLKVFLMQKLDEIKGSGTDQNYTEKVHFLLKKAQTKNDLQVVLLQA